MNIPKNQLFVVVLGVFFFFFLILFVIISFISSPKNIPVSPNTALPTPLPTFIVQPTFSQNLPKGDKIKISSITMNNFYSNPVEMVQNDVLIKNTSDFSIYFLGNFKTFLISITTSPFEVARQTAENAFLTELGISQKDACLLNVEVTTAYKYNPDQSGIRYPLSFCVNSKE